VRRLEEQRLLTSEWNAEESRPRRFYQASEEGESVLDRLLADLSAVRTSLTERYVAATIRAVPAARPKEIATELHASIEDMVDGRISCGREVDLSPATDSTRRPSGRATRHAKLINTGDTAPHRHQNRRQTP